MLVCINGELVPREKTGIDIADGAFLYGDSLFETIKARRQTILLQQQHLDRLEHSAQLLAMTCHRQAIESSLAQLAEILPSAASRLRLTLSRGAGIGLEYPDPQQAWYLITAAPFAEIAQSTRERGLNCCTAPNRRVNPVSHLPQLKHGNYADCRYARNYALRCGADEAFFLDHNNNLLEGATCNIFALIDHCLVTPPLDNLVLDGVMRRQTLLIAEALGIPRAERRLPLSEALCAEELFVTNSLIDIMPVRKLDGKNLNHGNLWKKVHKAMTQRIES